MSDYIRLNRSLLEYDWFGKPEMFALFMHFLTCVHEKDIRESNKIMVQRGQMKTSLGLLSNATGLSVRTLRTCISKLKDWGLITTETCSHYTIIKIVDFDSYVNNNEGSIAVKTPKQRQKKEKPIKSKEEIEEETGKRKEVFYQQLVPYVQTYGKDMIRKFFDYWSEPNKSKSRMRWEQETTWDLKLRLQRWSRQQTGYNNGGKTTALHDTENKNYNEGLW